MDPSPSEAGAGPSFARALVVLTLLLAGSGLLVYGAWLACPPAGFAVAGLALLAAGVDGGRK